MIVQRFCTPSTDTNMKALLEVLGHQATQKVTFFASPITADKDDHWIPDANLPLVYALAQIDVPVVGPVYIVFDGNFLTTQRGPRYGEVKTVLDKAQNSGKAYFSPIRLDRSPHKMTPEDAKDYLLNISSEVLNQSSRPIYFALLSSMTEKKILETLGISESYSEV